MSNATKKRGAILLLATVITVVTVALALIYSATLRENDLRSQQIEGSLWPQTKVLHEFQLTDQYAKPFKLERLKNKWSFMFFGFTHCPDVCPTTLHTLQGVFKILNQTDGKPGFIQYIFVSVDPVRDSPTVLKDYVGYFNPAFIGLTGQAHEVDSLTKQLGIVHLKTDIKSDQDYTIEHTASILLINTDGHLIAIFSPPHDSADISRRFSAIRTQFERGS